MPDPKEYSLKEVRDTLAKSIKDKIKSYEGEMYELRKRELAKSHAAGTCPLCGQPDLPSICLCLQPMQKSVMDLRKSATKKSEDYIDTANSADPEKRLKRPGKRAGVLPTDKESRVIDTEEGSGGKIKKGKLPKGKKTEKAEVPMAKPPSGVNPTKAPTSNPKPPTVGGPPKAPTSTNAPKAPGAPAPALGKSALPTGIKAKTNDLKDAQSRAHAATERAHAAVKAARVKLEGPSSKSPILSKALPSMNRDLKTALMHDKNAGPKPSGSPVMAPKAVPKDPSSYDPVIPDASLAPSGLDLARPVAPKLTPPSQAPVAAPAKKPGIFARLLS